MPFTNCLKLKERREYGGAAKFALCKHFLQATGRGLAIDPKRLHSSAESRVRGRIWTYRDTLLSEAKRQVCYGDATGWVGMETSFD